MELDFDYRPWDVLTITGMASIGDWKWDSNVTDVYIYDENQKILNEDDPINLYLDKVPVGGAAQNTFALGLNYEALPGTRIRVDYNYYDQLYADFDPNSVGGGGDYTPWEVPDFGLVDMGLTYDFKFGSFDATLLGNVNNIFDTEYVSVANDGPESDAQSAQVWYGFGRTYTIGAKLKF